MIQKQRPDLSNHFAKLHKLLGDEDPKKEKASRFTLARFLDSKKISYMTALNALQSAGVISDNVVSFCEDVYPADQVSAVKWLKKNTYTNDEGNQYIKGYNG